MTWSWRIIGPFLISFIIGAKNFLPTFQLMPRSSIDLRRELDPEDSISREGISDERSRDLGNMDLDHSSDTPSTTTFVKPKTSNYVTTSMSKMTSMKAIQNTWRAYWGYSFHH